ncbi:MAG: transposase, partial [Deltaproteobacteria bacterium]|nr:transposase [Deltaproteobacteria bacterium]
MEVSQTLWHCQYHIVWVPKYRYRILSGKIGREVEKCIRAFTEHQGCEVI